MHLVIRLPTRLPDSFDYDVASLRDHAFVLRRHGKQVGGGDKKIWRAEEFPAADRQFKVRSNSDELQAINPERVQDCRFLSVVEYGAP